MQALNVHLSRVQTQRHWALFPSLGHIASTERGSAGTGAERIPTAVKPVSREDVGADWLDTPAAHCSPLDDY